jgi:hypothetical protein
MGAICSSETLVRNYHYSLRNNPEERSSYLDLSPPMLRMNGAIHLLPLKAFMARAGKALPFIALSPNNFVKVHPGTGTEALYRPYGLQGE